MSKYQVILAPTRMLLKLQNRPLPQKASICLFTAFYALVDKVSIAIEKMQKLNYTQKTTAIFVHLQGRQIAINVYNVKKEPPVMEGSNFLLRHHAR